MCALLFCARILVTHRSKEKYLIAEPRGSRVKYLVSGAWNINYAERKKNKQTDTTTKILPDSTEREGTAARIVCKTGEAIHAEIYDCEFWSSVGHERRRLKFFVRESRCQHKWPTRISKLLDKTNKRNYSIGHQNLYLIVIFFSLTVAAQCWFFFLLSSSIH